MKAEAKKCTKCGVFKSLNQYYKHSGTKSGLRPDCKACYKSYSKKYHEENRDSIRLNKKEYREKNKKSIAEKQKIYYTQNREYFKSMSRQNYWKDPAKALLRSKEYREKNKKALKEKHKKYYQDNKEEIIQKVKKWNNDNSEKVRIRMKKYRAENRQDLNNKRKEYYNKNKLLISLRNRTCKAFNKLNYKKNSKTHEILGAELSVVKKYIERQFKNGMTWDNYGEWHVDHKRPLSSAKTEKELYRLCHYRNLQPLWAKENLRKGAKIIKPVQTFLPL